MMRILVADKDSSILISISARLKPRHYEVIERTSSDEVLHYLDREHVDLLLLSTEMERIEGRLLIEEIRRRHHLRALPIIMLVKENEISELLMSYQRGFDDFLIKPFSPIVLQLRVAMNISRSQIRTEANALTQLPGNVSIEKEIRGKIERHEKFSMLYIDINHFKSFNDRYGFEKGDDVIRQTAKLLVQMKQKNCGDTECFVGHIGGDDFIVIMNPAHEEAFARDFIAEFDRIIPTYYSEQDQKQGYIRVPNRKGKSETFPVMSCSVAAITNLYRTYQSLGEIAQDIAEVKSFLKTQTGGSHYLRDRRSSPLQKLDQAVQMLMPEMEKVKHEKKEKKEKKGGAAVDPLGKILLNAGLINQEQLSRAIKRHMLTGQRLGQTLISMNLVRSEDVGAMLEKKLGVPYISLKNFTPVREILRLFTKEFMKSHRVVPLDISGDVLKLAMCDPFDLKTLDAIERMYDLKPIPSFALEDEFEEFMESYVRVHDNLKINKQPQAIV